MVNINVNYCEVMLTFYLIEFGDSDVPTVCGHYQKQLSHAEVCPDLAETEWSSLKALVYTEQWV